MRKDLNITVSLLSTTWKELEKTMIDLALMIGKRLATSLIRSGSLK